MFVAGSMPRELVPQSDLDIFIVIKNRYRDAFFNNLKSIMNKFTRDKRNLTYSFYGGPLKYKNKGLIHFIICTDVRTHEGASFEEGLLQMLKHFKVSGNVKIISGENIAKLAKNVDWNDKKRAKKDIESVSKHYAELINKKYVVYKQWKIVNGNWTFTKTWKKPSRFLFDYLCRFYKKNLSLKTETQK